MPSEISCHSCALELSSGLVHVPLPHEDDDDEDGDAHDGDDVDDDNRPPFLLCTQYKKQLKKSISKFHN